MFPMYSYLVISIAFAQELEWAGYLLGYRAPIAGVFKQWIDSPAPD